LEHYALGAVLASHRSRIGGRRQRLIKPDGTIEDIFPRNYWPGDHPLDHVEFVFKYENLSLDLLEQVFRKIPPRTWTVIWPHRPRANTAAASVSL